MDKLKLELKKLESRRDARLVRIKEMAEYLGPDCYTLSFDKDTPFIGSEATFLARFYLVDANDEQGEMVVHYQFVEPVPNSPGAYHWLSEPKQLNLSDPQIASIELKIDYVGAKSSRDLDRLREKYNPIEV